jgi:hypothetical protein
MPDAIKGTEGAFLRQRRSLILLSTLILFLSITGISFTSDIHFLNVTLKAENLHAVYLLVWFVWWWFLYRYYQYYKQEGEYLVRNAVNSVLISAINLRLNRNLKDQQEGKNEDETGYRSSHSVTRHSFFSLKAQIATRVNNERGKFHEHNLEDVSFRVAWKDYVSTYYDFFMRRSEFTDYVFPIIYAFVAYIYSFIFSDWNGSIWKLIK